MKRLVPWLVMAHVWSPLSGENPPSHTSTAKGRPVALDPITCKTDGTGCGVKFDNVPLPNGDRAVLAACHPHSIAQMNHYESKLNDVIWNLNAQVPFKVVKFFATAALIFIPSPVAPAANAFTSVVEEIIPDPSPRREHVDRMLQWVRDCRAEKQRLVDIVNRGGTPDEKKATFGRTPVNPSTGEGYGASLDDKPLAIGDGAVNAVCSPLTLDEIKKVVSDIEATEVNKILEMGATYAEKGATIGAYFLPGNLGRVFNSVTLVRTLADLRSPPTLGQIKATYQWAKACRQKKIDGQI